VTNPADDLAQWLLQHVQMPATPPIDVEDLAKKMGITSITDASIIEDGRLEQDGRTAAIFLRSGLPTNRRRFTIAHEIGHRLLLHPKAPAERYRNRMIGDAEERLCDDIAAAILLPRSWVSANFLSSPHTLHTVRRLAATTRTSLSASLVRLCEIAKWRESLLRFKFVDQKWRLDAPAAVPPEVYGQIRTTVNTSQKLQEVGQTARGDVLTRLPIRIGEHEYTVQAELSVARTVAMALLDLRSLPLRARPPL
jgi:Zn-dependent peptidase ImmA (M78 family)